MYESYWRKMGNNCGITFNGDDSLSYFANGKSLCWFLESKLEELVKKLHNVVRHAIVDDHYIVLAMDQASLCNLHFMLFLLLINLIHTLLLPHLPTMILCSLLFPNALVMLVPELGMFLKH
ncbi:hypothetical protein MTR67_044044 [Solanum verrucosum]|uniref:Alliinase C-terminal domain-containing protein n=1 Tax=Solanum verrucosum TaxID=315347 RepID=A0AAF0ZVP8_SOLVR|nr:hypothetical protein MTR67_044044 [Solanum verrucosum]